MTTLDFRMAEIGITADHRRRGSTSASRKRWTSYGNTAGPEPGTFEKHFGSIFNDHLYGNSADNRIFGGRGLDYLEGRDRQ